MKRMKKLSLYSSVVISSLLLSACGEDPVVDPPCTVAPSQECPKPCTSSQQECPPQGGVTVTVSAERTSLRVNETSQLIAQGKKSDGSFVELTSVTFSSSDSSIAEVDPNTGLVTARGTGTATLTATSAEGKGTLTFKTEGGAVHKGTLSRSETWYAKDNPHYVLDNVSVEGDAHPTLTIEPGVIIRFAAKTGLHIGLDEPGTLKAEGTAEKPIRFVADAPSPTPGFWQSLDFGDQSGTDSKLAHAELSHCGSYHPSAHHTPCIFLQGNFTDGGARPVLTDVSISHGAGSGVEARADGAFGPGSARVSVRDSGTFSFSIEPNYASTLPTGGTLERNDLDHVEISGGQVLKSQTWPNLGVPYVLSGDVTVAGPRSPVLTLPPGLHLRMARQVGLYIADGEPGGLRAEGTPQSPILFTAHSAGATPGFWDGIFFDREALTTSLLSYAVVEYATGNTGWYNGDVVIKGDKGAIVKHTEFRHAACGIVRETLSTDEAFATDFTAPGLGNTFGEGLGAHQCGPR